MKERKLKYKTLKFAVTVSSAVGFCLLFRASCFAYPVEVASPIIPIVDREYLPEARELINKAGKSISLSMFVVKRGEMVNRLISV